MCSDIQTDRDISDSQTHTDLPDAEGCRENRTAFYRRLLV